MSEQIDDEIEYPSLSVNKSWQGRKFKTPLYSKWRFDLELLLKKKEMVMGWVEIELHFYIKSFGITDADNLVKCFVDSLVNKDYIEDDRKVVHYDIWKHKIKGREKIKFIIKKYGN